MRFTSAMAGPSPSEDRLGRKGGGRSLRVDAVDLVDVLSYLVVLGAFTQLFPAVITETFVLALLTAVLLKVVLEGVLFVKSWLLARFRTARTTSRRVTSLAMLLLVLPGSKFVVLELVAVLFAGQVSLGGFVSVTALIVVLMLTREGVRRLVARPDRRVTDGV